MLPFVLSLIFLTVTTNAAKDPPTLNGSYTAQAEMVEIMAKYGNRIMQIFFKENYDVERNKSSFFVWEDNQNVIIIEDYTNNQTFQYYNKECSMYTYNDWVSSNVLDIKPYEINNTTTFPLKQLLKLNKSTLREGKESKTIYRNMSAVLWKHRVTYETQDVNVILEIDAYWSDDWTIASGNKLVPLGFILHRTEENKASKDKKTFIQTINIFYFAVNVVDQKAFPIPEGMACFGLKNTLPFPEELLNITVFAFNLEFILDGYQEFRTVDVWWDIKNRFLRIDLDSLKIIRVNEVPAISRIISYKQGTIYTISKTTRKCELLQLENYPFEPQIFIEPSDSATWNIRNFFGLDDTSLIYIGDTEKRGIPCSIWQGERLDWPSFYRPTTTLWEWCIATAKEKKAGNSNKKDIPIINLEITVKEVPDKKDNVIKKGMKFIYHFYNMKKYTPAYMDTLAFDISPCFEGNNLKLQFFVNLNQSEKDVLKNATNDVNLISLWKSAINHNIGLNFTSLRITKFRTLIEGNKLIVMFTLLGVHPDLRKDAISTEISLDAAKLSLESVINNGNLWIYWIPKNKKPITLKAAPKSLTEQGNIPIDNTKSSTSDDEITSQNTITDNEITTQNFESTYSQKFTAITDRPTDGSSSTKESIATGQEITTNPTNNPSNLTQDKQIRHSPGIMALVSILMLFTGSGIGAAGTYYKFKGIPCKK